MKKRYKKKALTISIIIGVVMFVFYIMKERLSFNVKFNPVVLGHWTVAGYLRCKTDAKKFEEESSLPSSVILSILFSPYNCISASSESACGSPSPHSHLYTD